MPGPMLACARSTGAMLPRWRSRSAAGSSRLSALRKSRRVVRGASSGRGRQTRTTEDAKALTRTLRATVSSVRMGQVPVMEKTCPDKSFEHGLPPCGCDHAHAAVFIFALNAIEFSLLESVKDRYGVFSVTSSSHQLERGPQSILKKPICLRSIATEPEGSRDEFLSFGDKQRAEYTREQRLQ